MWASPNSPPVTQRENPGVAGPKHPQQGTFRAPVGAGKAASPWGGDAGSLTRTYQARCWPACAEAPGRGRPLVLSQGPEPRRSHAVAEGGAHGPGDPGVRGQAGARGRRWHVLGPLSSAGRRPHTLCRAWRGGQTAPLPGGGGESGTASVASVVTVTHWECVNDGRLLSYLLWVPVTKVTCLSDIV